MAVLTAFLVAIGEFHLSSRPFPYPVVTTIAGVVLAILLLFIAFTTDVPFDNEELASMDRVDASISVAGLLSIRPRRLRTWYNLMYIQMPCASWIVVGLAALTTGMLLLVSIGVVYSLSTAREESEPLRLPTFIFAVVGGLVPRVLRIRIQNLIDSPQVQRPASPTTAVHSAQ
jgi:hypothetical protein